MCPPRECPQVRLHLVYSPVVFKNWIWFKSCSLQFHLGRSWLLSPETDAAVAPPGGEAHMVRPVACTAMAEATLPKLIAADL